ncbi:MAG: hypothetical protein JNJ45_04260 [Chthonomonas sp.]|nr:hypothetical protein [Chthonomonas sp.]
MSDFKDNVTELAQLMQEFGLEEAKLSGEDWSVELAREPKTRATMTMGVAPSPATGEAPAAKPKEKPKASAAPKGVPVASPMMGIYYSSPSPGSPVFVKEGDTVIAGQVVGLIEAMKVFNEITAAMAGTVTKIAAKNGDMLQPGEPILFIG